MRNSQRLLVLLGGLALSAAVCPPSHAQTVILDARVLESVTVNVTGGATVNFALRPNTAANAGSTTSTIRTAWVLRRGRTRVSVWAWVPKGAAALTDGAGDNIPASAVTATVCRVRERGWRIEYSDERRCGRSSLHYAGCGHRRTDRPNPDQPPQQDGQHCDDADLEYQHHRRSAVACGNLHRNGEHSSSGHALNKYALTCMLRRAPSNLRKTSGSMPAAWRIGMEPELFLALPIRANGRCLKWTRKKSLATN